MRQGGIELTALMREQFEARRRVEHQRLADHVLRVVGAHTGKRVLRVNEIVAHQAELLTLAADLKAWYTSEERSTLYRNNEPISVAIVVMVLSVAGFEVDECEVRCRGKEVDALELRRSARKSP